MPGTTFPRIVRYLGQVKNNHSTGLVQIYDEKKYLDPLGVGPAILLCRNRTSTPSRTILKAALAPG